MNIIRLTKAQVDCATPLAAAFRVALKSYKGIAAKADLSAGKAELLEYLEANFPVFLAMEQEICVGYLVCRIEKPTVWVESIYVTEPYRRKGVASALFQQAENLAASFGEQTVFNYVHPNNYGMIAFLKKHGYTVLNLIEIRKPYPNEKLSEQIQVGPNLFNY